MLISPSTDYHDHNKSEHSPARAWAIGSIRARARRKVGARARDGVSARSFIHMIS